MGWRFGKGPHSDSAWTKRNQHERRNLPVHVARQNPCSFNGALHCQIPISNSTGLGQTGAHNFAVWRHSNLYLGHRIREEICVSFPADLIPAPMLPTFLQTSEASR